MRLNQTENSLHVAWKFPFADAVSVSALRKRMAAAEELRLFGLRSWSFRNGRARAILTPSAPLEDIVAVIWAAFGEPEELRLVETRAVRASTARSSRPA